MTVEMNNDGKVGEILWVKSREELIESGVDPDNEFLDNAGAIMRVDTVCMSDSVANYYCTNLLTGEEIISVYFIDADIKYRLSITDLIGMIKSNFRMINLLNYIGTNTGLGLELPANLRNEAATRAMYQMNAMRYRHMYGSDFIRQGEIYGKAPNIIVDDMPLQEQPTQFLQEGLPYSETDRETALLHLKFFLNGGGTDCFGEKLMAVIAKADCNNLKRLRRGFPTHVEVWEDYYKGRINSKGETK